MGFRRDNYDYSLDHYEFHNCCHGGDHCANGQQYLDSSDLHKRADNYPSLHVDVSGSGSFERFDSNLYVGGQSAATGYHDATSHDNATSDGHWHWYFREFKFRFLRFIKY